MTSLPDFHSIPFLEQHILDTMAFYDGRCVDPDGGFFHYFLDDGSVYDRRHRHLVSSTRFVVNYARAARYFGRPDYAALARHGLDFIEQRHAQPDGGYAWLLDGDRVEDGTNHCYGLAFVLLAYAEALKSGVDGAAEGLARAAALLRERFWDDGQGLLVDEYDAGFRVLSPYRGQNANMHGCEALLAAFEASGDLAFLDQAERIAEGVTGRLASQAGGLVWEHYDADWRIDWDYNRNDPRHLFRPWGFQPGHQTEWAKLLLNIDRLRPRPILVERACRLFERAVGPAWDHEHGGLVYGIGPDMAVCDSDKYFWVQAESLAAAAVLHERTGEQGYLDWYLRLWEYSWAHMIDHEHGAWYRILDARNRRYSNEKSPAGKTDYHTMGACFEAIEALRRLRERA
jgi:mannose/cellobiose epimerase-like protein (N-acyl-D-glucosamine 2-epimerase family)